MKRFVSILVIVAVLVSLCPAAFADDDVEALKKRIAELEAEIEQKDAIIAEKDAIIAALAASIANKPAAEQNNRYETEDGNVYVKSQDSQSSTQPFFEIYDARLQRTSKDGIYLPDVKFKCTYPQNEQNMTFMITFHFLDKDGAIVKQYEIHLDHLNYGDIGWTCSFSNGRATQFQFDSNEVTAFGIAGYRAHNNNGHTNEYYHLSEPIVFNIADLKIA